MQKKPAKGRKVAKARPARAWAVVRTKDPAISILDIFRDRDVKMGRGERLARVLITEI